MSVKAIRTTDEWLGAQLRHEKALQRSAWWSGFLLAGSVWLCAAAFYKVATYGVGSIGCAEPEESAAVVSAH